MVFVDQLNHILEHYNAPPIEGIRYEQYMLLEFNGVVIIKEDSKDLAVVDSIQQAKELCDSINSGC